MDKGLIRERFAKAKGSYLGAANIQRQTAEKLMELMQQHIPQQAFEHICEIGCGTGLFTRLLIKAYRFGELSLNDICPEVKDTLGDCLRQQVSFHPGDAEQMALPGEPDMIVSCSVLQWFEYPELFIRKCFVSIRPGGYLAFATYGDCNLQEITALTGQSLHYHPLRAWRDMIRKYFEIIHAEEELLPLHFNTPVDVLRHFKETGVSGVRRQQWSPGRLTSFCDEYRQRFETSDGSVPLTYHPLFMICKKQEDI